MNDVINRQEAIDELLNTKHTMFDTDGCIWVNRNEVQLRIKELPSAEPEIIRCKECKHSHLTYDGKNKYCVHWPNNAFSPTEYIDGGFYCGFAKRREGEE